MTPAGYLRADAFISRVGIQEYRQPDGTTRRELRLPEEVFHADALESFAGVPITDDHPVAMLSPDNARDHARGNVSDPKASGRFVRASVLVTDAELIRKMRDGKTQISCGYVCDLEETPGEWHGQKYDAIQRAIRGNHVAVVDGGRAGPEVAARMDALDAEIDGDAVKEQPMKKVVIDGVEYEVTDQVAQALDKERGAQGAREKSLKADADKAAARADGAEAKVAAAEKARKDAEDPEKLRARINSRVKLEKVAAEHLDGDVSSKSDREIKIAVVEKLSGKVPAEKRDSDDYVDGRFDQAVGDVGSKSLDEARGAADKASTTVPQDRESKARADRAEHVRSLHTKPIPGSISKEVN